MSAVEVLAPLRLETRFVAPEDRTDGVNEWMLRLRVYPDEFSIARPPAPPTPEELDRLEEAVASLSAPEPIDKRAAFASFASIVGADRAFGLWRRYVTDDGAGGLSVDRGDATAHKPFVMSTIAGLPDRLEVWFVHASGLREQKAELNLDLEGIAADLDKGVFETDSATALLAEGTLPETWWLSYRRAREDVDLGVDIDCGPVAPDLDALVVIGIGDADAAALVHAHNAANRLAVLAQGSPTNTVAGEPTTDLGGHAESLFPLLDQTVADQSAGSKVLGALAGGVDPAAQPMLGGDDPGADLDCASIAVRALWPVLWGRALRDVTGAGPGETQLSGWAAGNLAVSGPRPAFRVGNQPYGLLPMSTFGQWTAEPGDDLAEVEDRILGWALPWRGGAAAAARSADHRVHDSDTGQLLAALGAHAPSRHWQVRPVGDLPLIQAQRAIAGLPSLPASTWDRDTALAWRQWPYPAGPIGPGAHPGPVPGPDADIAEDPKALIDLMFIDPETLYYGEMRLGLVGHLVREAMICVRATIGHALEELTAGGGDIELGVRLPLDDETSYRFWVMRGSDDAAAELEQSGLPNARFVGQQLEVLRDAIKALIARWEQPQTREPMFRAVLAALDTASFRVDPWLTGIAERRLQRMINAGNPFLLGAYGWVDAPKPYDPDSDTEALAPGPTKAGLLHAPSHTQALTAALLRDAAVRYPGDERWKLNLDSAKVRAATALAERVRLGVHPYEALGLEVEKIAGDWDSVRTLREKFALADDQQLRRVCDGAKVLAAARTGGLPAGLAPDLADRLKPLDHVLDTYADLLVADGIHALVGGRGDLANAAMEAAAGLGAPPELRAIRTPREGSDVAVSVWALLPDDAGLFADPDDPLAVGDPAYAALIGDGYDPARLALLLGGGEDNGAVPSLTGGSYPGLPALGDDGHNAADTALRAAMFADLTDRLTRIRDLAQARHDAVELVDDDDPAVGAAATAWHVAIPVDGLRDAVLAELTARIAGSADGPPAGGPGSGDGSLIPDAAINAVRQKIRLLAGRPELPVLPIVDSGLLPDMTDAPDMDRDWLEIVAAVRPRLTHLEAQQFDEPWQSAISAPGGATDPWRSTGPVVVVYTPKPRGAGRVALAALDGWTDSIPSRNHATTAAFGFNSPKSRAPQAVLVAVPPDPEARLDNSGLLDVVLETRELVAARAARPRDRGGLPYATPAPLVHAAPRGLSFLNGWP